MKYTKYREYLERTAREQLGEPEPKKFDWWDLALWFVALWGVYLVAHLVVSIW